MKWRAHVVALDGAESSSLKVNGMEVFNTASLLTKERRELERVGG